MIDPNNIVVKVTGRLDTATSLDFREELNSVDYESMSSLVLDFDEVEYVSSAGLRELLIFKKKMGDKRFVIQNVYSAVKGVFEMTGFSIILDYFVADNRTLDYRRISFKELVQYKRKHGINKTIIEGKGVSFNWEGIEKGS